MRMSEKIDQIAVALLAAQKEMPAVKKDAVNPFFKSKYAKLEGVIEDCQPVLNKHGISVLQFPVVAGANETAICTMLLHVSGQFIAGDLLVNAKTDDPQGQGSAITYARRYAYLGAVSVATEDDDAEAAMAKHRKPQPLKAVNNPKMSTAENRAASPPPDFTPMDDPGYYSHSAVTAAPAGTARPVTDKQLTRLYAIAHSKLWTREDVAEQMIEWFQKHEAKDLTRFEYDKLCNHILAAQPRE